jgi:tRNA (mo5U34)-methyltransferase
MQHELIKTSYKTLKDYIERYSLSFESDCSLPVIRIFSKHDLTEDFHQKVESTIQLLKPWRVGPYQIFNTLLDAEWNSDFKWKRFANYLPDLKDKVVADVGCNNGYFLFRLSSLGPIKVVGFDPFQFFAYQHEFLKLFIKSPSVEYKKEGVENLTAYPEEFDLLLCLGVIAHRRDPFQAIKNLYLALKPGGTAIIENIIIDTPEPYTDISGRYAQMHNIYRLSNKEGFIRWLELAGFAEIEVLSISKTDNLEQRSTPFMVYRSLKDFLNPEDHTKTVEGYPAPERLMVKASKSL